ncbi:MAG TPA: M1 family metallopeptidase [Chitinophagaceae bacterium]|nr:M1 family metallopeptidase [Chitinophagaceae bacterium]
MKKQLLLLFFIAAVYGATAQDMDVLHYQYSIELNDKTDVIYGKAAITVSFPTKQNLLQFDLTDLDAKGKGMILDSIRSRNRNTTLILPRTNWIDHEPRVYHANKKISWSYNVEKWRNSARDTDIITVYYHGIPSDGLIISKNKFNKKTFFADNWPNRAHNWIPCNDEIWDKATVEFIVTAPSPYQVISNGIQLEETNLPGNKKLTHWKEDVALPTKVMVIGVAEFAVQHAGMVNNCIPVSSWVFADNKAAGFYDYAPAVNILQWFNDYIGTYPYKKLANVQSKTIFGGMENAGAIFYFENSVDGKQSHESLMAHEIVHQWFGDMATEKSFAHLWLSEGFASYLTHMYMEAKYGTDSLNKRMKDDRDGVLDFVKREKRPVVDTVSNYMKLLNANSYQKGSWILHMLRRQLGDSVFHKSIRDYYAAYAGKNADTKDLQKIFEKNSGKDLGQFFKQWLYTNENPALKITWNNIKKDGKIAITVEQMQNEIFEFPLDLLLISGLRKNKSEQLQITKRVETFYFLVKSEILQVDADYSTSLLAETTVKPNN